MEYYVGYATPASYDLQHYGILGMHWGVRRYQPYPSGYTGEGQYVGDREVDSRVARKNVKRAIKNIDKKGAKALQARDELTKAEVVLGKDYVDRAIKKYNVHKATMKAAQTAAAVGLTALSVYTFNQLMDKYVNIGGAPEDNPTARLFSGMDKAPDLEDIGHELNKAGNRITEGLTRASGALDYGSKVVGNRIKEQQIRSQYGEGAYNAAKAVNRADEWLTKNVKNPVLYGGTVASNRLMEGITDPDLQDQLNEYMKKLH